jgi:hypothetical protein
MREELLASVRKASRTTALTNYANDLITEAIDMSIEEPDWDKWQQTSGGSMVGGKEYRDLSGQDADRLRAQAWRLYWESSHIRNVIRTLVKFVFGKGVTIKLNEDRPELKKKGEEYFTKWSKINKWPLKQKEMASRAWRDGEAFVHTRNLGLGTPPRLEFANPDIVRSDKPDATFGIRMNPVDPTMPLEYILKKNPESPTEIIIPAASMVHVKTCVDSDVKRGRTILEPIMRPTRMYEDWIRDRLVLNKVRSALAVVRIVNGTPNQIKSITGQNRGERSAAAGYNRQKTWRPGTIITAPPGVDYKMLSANINASDAAQDGRNILLSMAVGVGFPDMYMTGDWAATNFASSAVAQNPFIRECEDQQDFFEPHIEDLVEQVFNVGKENGELPTDLDTSVSLEWPPLIQRDLISLVTALMQLFNSGLISRQTMASQTGFDYDHEKKLRFEEDAEKAIEMEMLGVEDPNAPPPGGGGAPGKKPLKPKQQQQPRPQGQTKQKVKINTK